jgi:pimeloyl-ACP methyl ester carboxylesterase
MLEDTATTKHTHQTAPTQFVEANGIRFAYRRLGEPEGVPIVLNQHFRGTMDYWDPAVTDGLAQSREVILFDNAGIASTSGEVPPSIPRWARTRSRSSAPLAFLRSISSAFPSAAWSRRRSPDRPQIRYAS